MMSFKNYKLMLGVTLLELMIVVAIVAILSAITYPHYMTNVRQARRADATAALSLLRTRQEFFFSTDNNRTYTTNLANLAWTGATTQDGNYNIAIAPCAGGTIAQCYVITATAVAGSSQADDNVGLNCTVLSIDSRGQRTPVGCWKR